MATQEIQEYPARRPGGQVSFNISSAAVNAVRRTAGMLWRHKLMIGVTTLLGTGAAVGIALQMTPLYTAETLVMLEHRKTSVVKFEEVLGGLGADMSVMQSEVAVLKSPTFAEKVVDKLGLVNDPEFNADLQPPPSPLLLALNPRNWIPDSWWASLHGDQPVIELTEEEKAKNRRTSVVNAVIDNLSVRPQGRSYVLSVSFDSEDPRKAATIANTIAQMYLVDQLDEKFKATKRATLWLEERIAEMRKEAREAGDAAEAFRAKTGLTASGDARTINTQQLAELNTNYVLARTQREAAEAKQREVQALAQNQRSVGTIGDVLGNALIQSLRRQEVEMQRQMADATQRYGSKHPAMLTLQSQLRDLQMQMRSEVDKIVQGLGNEVEMARGRERSLKASLDELQGKVDEQTKSSVALRTLERDADTSQTMYETLLTRFQEITSQNDIQQPDGRVVSQAAIPLLPTHPNKKLIAILAVIASGAIGVLLAMLVEYFERGFRSPHQFERATGVRGLGIVPTIGRWGRLGRSPADYAVDKPLSSFTEALQSLRTTLLLANPDGRQRVLLFTSSVPDEGKSSIAGGFARICANAGQRVVIVDCDMRRKGLHRMLSLDNTRGLYEVLSGQAEVQDVVQTDPRTGLHVISAGHGSALPQDMLGSARMHQLISHLALEYDRVILDSPPVLAVSESKLLAALADQTVFIVRWGKTKRETAMAGLKELVEAGADVVGVLFTQVDARRHAQYEFPDSGRYHGYRRYYVN
ncbi:GumC family protein [Azospirillum sp. sgz301742]